MPTFPNESITGRGPLGAFTVTTVLAGWDFFPSHRHIFPRFGRHFFDMIAA
jgi:hypothetical protein